MSSPEILTSSWQNDHVVEFGLTVTIVSVRKANVRHLRWTAVPGIPEADLMIANSLSGK